MVSELSTAIQEWTNARASGTRAAQLRAEVALHALAHSIAQRALRSFERDLGLDGLRTVIDDVLVRSLDSIAAARSPEGLLIVACRNRALNAKKVVKRLRTREELMGELEDYRQPESGTAMPEERERRLDRVLEGLRPLHREVVRAVACGEDRNVVAALHGLQRNSVDKIIARFAARLRKEEA